MGLIKQTCRAISMDGLHRTQCWHTVGLQLLVAHGLWLVAACRISTADFVHAVPYNTASQASPLLLAPADISNAGEVAGATRTKKLCTAATCAAARLWMRFLAPRAGWTPGCQRLQGQRGSALGGRPGEQGVKRRRRQGACQTRACAVCIASVLWVSAAAAGGSVWPGQQWLQPPSPHAVVAGADAQCGTRHGAGGRAVWGRLGRQLCAGGSRNAGRGGGEQAAQESAQSPGAGGGAGASRRNGAPGRTCTWQAAGPALSLPLTLPAAPARHW